MSRGPVRDALRTLEHDGLGVTQLRRGSSVAVFSRQDVEEIFSLRAELEGLAARWAVARLNDASLAELKRCHARVLRSARDPEKLIIRDIEFHRLVIQLLGHTRVIEACQRLEPQILLFRHRTRDLFVGTPVLAHRHDRAMQAFIDRDADAAEAAMREHVKVVQTRILALWSEDPGGGDNEVRFTMSSDGVERVSLSDTVKRDQGLGQEALNTGARGARDDPR